MLTNNCGKLFRLNKRRAFIKNSNLYCKNCSDKLCQYTHRLILQQDKKYRSFELINLQMGSAVSQKKPLYNQVEDSQYMILYVKTPKGDTYTVEILNDRTLQDIRDQVYMQDQSIRSEEYAISCCSGIVFNDEETALNKLNLINRSFLRLTPQVSSDSNLLTNFTFNSKNNAMTGKFSVSAPKYRILHKGLCLEGFCVKTSCQAFEQQVMVPLGFGFFCMEKVIDRAKCPICKEKTIFSFHPYFYQCKYTIDGRKNTEEERTYESQAQIDVSKYDIFETNFDDITQWKYLDITIMRL